MTFPNIPGRNLGSEQNIIREIEARTTREREDIGYSSAWLHHKGRNRHHYEYWVDYSTQSIEGGMAPVPMPRKYVAEMLMDRIAASKTYRGSAYKDSDPLAYYKKCKKSRRLCTYRRDGSWSTF